jgi:ditrans,polycis-polyprenyl diphosphate synthase
MPFTLESLAILLLSIVLFIWDRLRRWIRQLALVILKQGEIPKHLSIIMDGNRRFAKRQHMEVVNGHNVGFEKLKEVS